MGKSVGIAIVYAIEADNPIDLVDKFIAKCKEIDPDLDSIEIEMKGRMFDRSISRTWPDEARENPTD